MKSSALAFDPDGVLPKMFDFSSYVSEKKSEQIKAKRGAQGGAGGIAAPAPGDMGKLPRRILLPAFSTSVGWRPAGLNVGQVKTFVERFPTEFRMASLGKIVLPHREGLPYVTVDGKIPCPLLSTCNALKALQTQRDKLQGCDKRVVQEMQRVFDQGLQVEWQEFGDYLAFMLYYEGAAVQGDVVVKPHVLDTALLFLGFCTSKRGRALQVKAVGESAGNDAADSSTDVLDSEEKNLTWALGEGAKVLEDAFVKSLTGKAAHRFYDCRKILRNTQMEVLSFLVGWRKKAHFCHANAMSQTWFLSAEWGKIKGLNFAIEQPSGQQASPQLSAQQCVAEVCAKMISQAEITVKSDIPRLGRCAVNSDVFKEVASVIEPALEYFAVLKQKNLAAWYIAPAGVKLARRLLVDGENSLRSCFLAAYEQCGRNVGALNFMETDIGSDFAMVEEKLHTITLEKRAEAEAAKKSAAATALEAGASAGADQEPGTAASGALVVTVDGGKQAGLQLALEDTGPAVEDEAAAAQAREEARRTAALAEAADRKKKEDAAETEAIRSEARIAIDDVLTVFNNIPRTGCPPPALVVRRPGVVYVVPTQSYVRGRPSNATPVLQMQGLESLEWITSEDILLVGVGHDPAVVSALQGKLKSRSDNIKQFKWLPLVPVVQPKARVRGSACVEYLLVGYGPHAQSPVVPHFLTVRRGYPSARLRPTKCVKNLEAGQSAGNDAGDCEVCSIHTWARARFTTPLPNNPLKKHKKAGEAKATELAELMGGLPDDADSSDGSGDGELNAGDPDDSEESGVDEVGKVVQPKQVAGGGRWSSAWRWGWSSETWKPFLEKLAPELVVLCGSMHLQPGLILSVLSYNDSRFGLDRCQLYAFYPRDCGIQEDGVKVSPKHVEQGHMADHVLERVSTLYAEFRLAANKSARKRQLVRQSSLETAKRACPRPALAALPPSGEKGSELAQQPPAGNTAAGGGPLAAGDAEISAGNAAADVGRSQNASIKATLFIAVLNNAGPKAQLLPLPTGTSTEDSDEEECGGDAANMTHSVVSKRNCNMMTKHKLKINKSTGPEGTGHGLFTKEARPTGTIIPCKGVWFDGLEALNEWLEGQHPRTAEAMAKKVVEVNFSDPAGGAKVSKYLVMTSVVGYVNAYTNITQRANAQLAFNHERPLGQYSLSLKLTQDLAADKEILIPYGVKHLVRERKARGPKKIRKTQAKEE